MESKIFSYCRKIPMVSLMALCYHNIKTSHHYIMRTTLDIDYDILNAAKELSRIKRQSLGKVLSDLARQALSGDNNQPDDEPIVWGFSPFPARGTVITNEFIDQLRDTEGC
jgi:hypothetical protein